MALASQPETIYNERSTPHIREEFFKPNSLYK